MLSNMLNDLAEAMKALDGKNDGAPICFDFAFKRCRERTKDPVAKRDIIYAAFAMGHILWPTIRSIDPRSIPQTQILLIQTGV